MLWIHKPSHSMVVIVCACISDRKRTSTGSIDVSESSSAIQGDLLCNIIFAIHSLHLFRLQPFLHPIHYYHLGVDFILFLCASFN